MKGHTFSPCTRCGALRSDVLDLCWPCWDSDNGLSVSPLIHDIHLGVPEPISKAERAVDSAWEKNR